jgi:hypothetical protein
MSRRFTELFTCYRKTAVIGTTGEVTYTEAATVTNGRGLFYQKREAFAWLDRGRVTGGWMLLTECGHDIQANDKITHGSRSFNVVSVVDTDLRFQEVTLDAL